MKENRLKYEYKIRLKQMLNFIFSKLRKSISEKCKILNQSFPALQTLIFKSFLSIPQKHGDKTPLYYLEKLWKLLNKN